MAIEHAATASDLDVRRDRQWEAFVLLHLADANDECEVDIGIDHRALGIVSTRYGPTPELREFGANKVLAIFARAGSGLRRLGRADEAESRWASASPSLRRRILASIWRCSTIHARVYSLPRAGLPRDAVAHRLIGGATVDETRALTWRCKSATPTAAARASAAAERPSAMIASPTSVPSRSTDTPCRRVVVAAAGCSPSMVKAPLKYTCSLLSEMVLTASLLRQTYQHVHSEL